MKQLAKFFRQETACCLVFLTTLNLKAESFGDFNYRLAEDGTIEITSYPYDQSGETIIPATIDGLPVTAIGPRAFYLCRGLSGISIPPSVETIGEEAFGYCDNLTEIIVPSSVRCIGDRAFSNCMSLHSISVELENPHFVSLDGVLLNSELTRVIVCPADKIGDYAVPLVLLQMKMENSQGALKDVPANINYATQGQPTHRRPRSAALQP